MLTSLTRSLPSKVFRGSASEPVLLSATFHSLIVRSKLADAIVLGASQ
ncbi:hypothetical protein QUB05_17010 [Microcoleus sp. F10-C6]